MYQVIDADYIEVSQQNIDLPNDDPDNFNNDKTEDDHTTNPPKKRKVSTPGRAKRTFFFVFLAEASRFGMGEEN